MKNLLKIIIFFFLFTNTLKSFSDDLGSSYKYLLDKYENLKTCVVDIKQEKLLRLRMPDLKLAQILLFEDDICITTITQESSLSGRMTEKIYKESPETKVWNGTDITLNGIKIPVDIISRKGIVMAIFNEEGDFCTTISCQTIEKLFYALAVYQGN